MTTCTAMDIITDACLDLGVIAAGESLDGLSLAQHLRRLNRLLDTWSTDQALVYQVTPVQTPFVPNQQVYTCGTGGDINIPRPLKIELVSVLDGSQPVPVEIPIQIITTEEWRDIPVKNTPSTFPLAVWITGEYPLRNLWFWPIPQIADTMVIYPWSVLTEFSDLTTSIALPQGYEEALVSNLAIRLAPQYGVSAPAETVNAAKESIRLIKDTNWEPTYRGVDSALMGNGDTRSIWQRSRGYVLD